MITTYIRTLKVLAIGITIALPFVANASDTLVEKDHYSGFLKDYSQLKEEKDAKGDKVMRYISPKLTSGAYHKVMIDPVEFYPEPKPDKDVDSATLSQIKDYLGKELHQKIGEQAQVVNQPGPDVIRMRVAITAVGAENAPLKPYQYIPFAFIAHTVMKAAGDAAMDAELYTEVEVLDSQSGERLGAVVRKGTGTEVEKVKEGAEKGEKMVTLDNVKPILDHWAELAADVVGSTLHGQ